MSTELATLDVNTLIPDGIEPVEAMRCWNFYDGKLTSLNGVEWKPGQALSASCQAGAPNRYVWNVVRRGLSYQEAKSHADAINKQAHLQYQMQAQMQSLSRQGTTWQSVAGCPLPSSVSLPDGYGFELETETHEAPHENCTCGIYAATVKEQLPNSGTIYGKAKLWGKIVPGEKGVRAQYAYPSEFEAPAELAEHPELKAFGVPITVTEKRQPTTAAAAMNQWATQLNAAQSSLMWSGNAWRPLTPSAPKKPRMSPWLKWAIAVNLAACALNLFMALR